MPNLACFRSTHEVSKDFAHWAQFVPADDPHVAAVHVYKDGTGSQFAILEKRTCVPRRAWFEFEWHQGAAGRADTLEAAESALYHEYVQERAA